MSLVEIVTQCVFWSRFLSTDCLAYIGLFLSIRYRNWELRTGSIKELAAIFAAFDRPIYQQLVPHHIHELLLMPSHIATTSSAERKF